MNKKLPDGWRVIEGGAKDSADSQLPIINPVDGGVFEFHDLYPAIPEDDSTEYPSEAQMREKMGILNLDDIAPKKVPNVIARAVEKLLS